MACIAAEELVGAVPGEHDLEAVTADPLRHQRGDRTLGEEQGLTVALERGGQLRRAGPVRRLAWGAKGCSDGLAWRGERVAGLSRGPALRTFLNLVTYCNLLIDKRKGGVRGGQMGRGRGDVI